MTDAAEKNDKTPESVDLAIEAWELFNSRRFLHGHRETVRESFTIALKEILPQPNQPNFSPSLTGDN